ncbi:hypothetical protein BDN72DRAFT_524937 [Pluteus cervinus]|uniref:Uncharacterized protein n=1 Tax=Pluteus cervinus TaxID=181527 RepID=A0ACD3AYG1_9AGAR|nr:hypothetical protein BDN72DRAFT_524937 [Pluteus cervinus]
MPTAPATTTATQSEGRPVRSNRMQGGHAVQLQITGEAVSKPTRKPRKENTIPDATPTNPMAPPEPHIQTRRRRKAQPADSDDAHAEHDPPIASQPVRYNAKEGDRFGYRKPQASPPPSPSPPPPSSTPAPVSVKIGPPRRKLAPTPDIPQDNEEREDSGLSGTAPDHANGGAPDEAAIEGGDGEDEEDDDSGAAAQDEVEWVPLSSQGDMVIDEQSDDEDEAQARRNLLLTPAPFDISMDLEPFEEPMDHVPTKATPSRAKQTDTNKRRRNEDDVVDEVGADVVDEAGAEEPRTPPPHHVGLSDGDDSEDPEPVVLSYRERNRGSNLPRPTKKARKRSPSPLRHRTKPRDKKHRHSSHDSSKSRSKHSSQRHSSSRRSPSPISTDSSEDEGESKSKKRRDTQLKHYDPGWKKVLTTAKNYFRLHIAEERAFPDFEGGVSIGVKLLGKAVDEHNKKNTRVIAKAFNEDGMSRCVSCPLCAFFRLFPSCRFKKKAPPTDPLRVVLQKKHP